MGAGAKAKEFITDRDIRQKKLAEHLNISASAIGNYLSDRREMPHHVLVQIADYFQTTTDYLLGRTQNPAPPFELSKEEHRLISELRLLDTSDRQVVFKLIQFLKER